jgi:hypothetical protein
MVALGVILAGVTSGVVLSGMSASRQAASQLSDLQTRTVVLLRMFEDVAGADSFSRFSKGVIDLSKSVTAFTGLSFPRVGLVEDEVTAVVLKATSSFFDAAICWADYEDPGRLGREAGLTERGSADLSPQQVIEGKRKALERRVAEMTPTSNLYAKVAEQRANMAREAEGTSDEGLARAQAMGEVRRIAEERLAATECVRTRRAEGLSALGGIYNLLDIPR